MNIFRNNSDLTQNKVLYTESPRKSLYKIIPFFKSHDFYL